MKSEANLLAFQVVGDGMDDGTRQSFEHGDKLIVEPVSIDSFKQSIDNDLNSFWVIKVDESVLFKQITGYDHTCETITCHSLNPNGQYPDIFLRLDNIDQMYRVRENQRRIRHFGDEL